MTESSPSAPGPPWLLLSRLALGALLIVLSAGAFVYERGEQPLVRGEATVLMQAMSLVHDFDLTYERGDYDRFTILHRAAPTDLELISGAEGRRIAFADPFPQAVWLAPWIALAPRGGFAAANVLLLALAALFVVRSLEKRIGAPSAFLVAFLIVGSVVFRYVYLATHDLFLLCLAAIAFALLVDAEKPRTWWIAGALLATCLATEPLSGGLLIFAALFFRRDAARGALLLGTLIATIMIVAVQWWSGGGLHFFGAVQFRFTPETGFPLVDFAAAEWNGMLHRLQALHWDGAPRRSWGLDPALWGWNLLDLFFGRAIGLLPYFPFLPLLLVGAWFRRSLGVAFLLWLPAVLALFPFTLHGGEGAVGNRLFLPLYGALWIALGEAFQERRRSAFGACVVGVLLATLFLGRLWSAPWMSLASPERGANWPTAIAQRILPHETAQRRLPYAQDAELSGLRVRFLTAGAWAETLRDRLMIDGEAPVEMVIMSPERLDVLRFELGPDAPSEIEVSKGALEERLLLPDGGVAFRLSAASRRHPLWWTPQSQWIYRVAFRVPGAEGSLSARLSGEQFVD